MPFLEMPVGIGLSLSKAA